MSKAGYLGGALSGGYPLGLDAMRNAAHDRDYQVRMAELARPAQPRMDALTQAMIVGSLQRTTRITPSGESCRGCGANEVKANHCAYCGRRR